MGLIGSVLLAPITGPVWGFRLFVERLRDEADAVLHDEGRAFAELIQLSMRRNAGQLSEAEFAEQEKELLQRLSSIRDYKDELEQGDLEEDEIDALEGDWVDDEPLDADAEIDDGSLGGDTKADEVVP